MKYIIKESGKGKTVDCIKECEKIKKSIIVCFSLQEAGRVADTARELGINIPMPITFDEALSLKNSYYEYFIIDNIDMILQEFLPRKIHAITMTGSHYLS